MFSGLINFNELFTSYAKSKDPDFGVIYGVDYNIRESDGYVEKEEGKPKERVKDIYGADLVNEKPYIQIGNYLSEDVVIYRGDEATGTYTYTQVVGCYDKISAVIEFGGPLIMNFPVTCISAELDTDFCKCNVLVPYTRQLWIRISGYWYPFNVIQNKPQIMIISKEESQGQVQVYIEEIIQENPTPSLETGLRTSCEGLAVNICIDKKYCDLQCGPCLLSCSLFKRGRCEGAGYCKWTVDNICKCSGAVEEGPICGDNQVESGEECDDGNTVDGDGCEGDCMIPAEFGKTCRINIGCGGGFSCVEDPFNQGIYSCIYQ